MQSQPTHQELARRMDSFDQKMTLILEKLGTMEASITQVEHDVSKTKEIVEAWSAVKTVGKFVKWVASLGTGVVAIYMLLKTGIVHSLGK